MPNTSLTNNTYWVYMLTCSNGSYYTGYTTNLMRRYQEHLTGTIKCKYTRSFKPLNVAQCWPVTGTQSYAMKIENYIKRLSKEQKNKLVLNPEYLFAWFKSTE